MDDEAKRMVMEAMGRIHDADLLSGQLNRTSDSDAVLRVLGFEILLKCALLVAGTRPARTHRYTVLWSQLPPDVRDDIIRRAQKCMPGQVDFSDMPKLLTWYQFVFERARYHYELFEGYSLEDEHELGVLWIALGAPSEEALVQYFPLELTCLIHGLKEHLDSAA